MPDDAPLLLPAPRQLERHGGWCTLPARPRVVRDPAVPGEGYRLDLTADDCVITTADAAGERHARATLAQLRTHYGARIPTLTITDAPVFAVRGAMLDVSRDRIPTMAEFGRIIPLLASFKFNHLQLYVEHTVAYAGHEAAWAGLDPLTPDELRALDALCAAHGIELAANQNCFGHLSGFLKLPAYQHLAEIAVDGTWDFNGLVTRTGPFSLCPSEPAALTFISDLLAQLCPLIRSPWVNIGCDETFDVGQGKSRAAVAQRGRAPVYLDFVRQVCALVQSHGKRPQFWADIALEHPEYLHELPADLCGLAWGYEGDARFGAWCSSLIASGHTAWVCPGTSSWRSFTGRTSERRANLLAAAEQGAAHGASGFLVTDWGDIGHRQQWPISLHGLAEAAHRAWSGTQPFDARAAGLHAFGHAAIGPWLDALGDADHALRLVSGKPRPDGTRAALRNATALFTDLHLPLDAPGVGSNDAWEQVDHRLAELQKTLPVAPDARIARELAHAVAMARICTRRALARRRRDQHGLHAVAATYRALMHEHRDLWLARCRAGGLVASSAHDEKLIAELEHACV